MWDSIFIEYPQFSLFENLSQKRSPELKLKKIETKISEDMNEVDQEQEIYIGSKLQKNGIHY